MAELTRGDPRERGLPYNTLCFRNHPLRFLISRYEGDSHGRFECTPPGEVEETWGIERGVSERRWDVPRRCAPMQNGYIYVFRGPRDGKLNKGRFYAAYEVKNGRYIPLEVAPKQVFYDKPKKETPQDIAVFEQYAGGAHVDPYSPLSIVESKIRLSQNRLFGPGGLIHNPARRGIPFSLQLLATNKLPPAGHPPTDEEVSDFFDWSHRDGMVSAKGSPLEPWKRQRRFHERGFDRVVELFSVDPFAEARRRNANCAHAIKKRLEYLQDPERAKLCYLAEIYEQKLKESPENIKHINRGRLNAWTMQDKQTRKKLGEAVEKAAQHCVDWLLDPLFHEWLLDYAHADDEKVQHLAVEAYLDAIADLNATVAGKAYLRAQYENKNSFFHRAIGFSPTSKPKDETLASAFPLIRSSATLVMKLLELHVEHVVRDAGDSYRPSPVRRSKPHSTGLWDADGNPVSRAAKTVQDATDLNAGSRLHKVDAVQELGVVADALKVKGQDALDELLRQGAKSSSDLDRGFFSDRFGLPEDLALKETALSKAIREGHRGARQIKDFLERRTGVAFETLQFRNHLERLQEHGRIQPQKVREILQSPLAAAVGLHKAVTSVQEAEGVASKVLEGAKSLSTPRPSPGVGGLQRAGAIAGQAKAGGKSYGPEHWRSQLKEGTFQAFNRIGFGLDLLNAVFVVHEMSAARDAGKPVSAEEILGFSAATADVLGSGLALIAGTSWATPVAKAAGYKVPQAVLDAAAKKGLEDAGEHATREIAQRSMERATERAIQRASRKSLQSVSGALGVVSGCADLISGIDNAADQFREGDHDAMLSWSAVAAGGAAGIVGGVLLAAGAGGLIVAGLAVAAVALPLVGAVSLIWTDDTALEVWLQDGYFGIDGGNKNDLHEQIGAYHQLVFQARLNGVNFREDGLYLEVQPGLMSEDMLLIVHLQSTSPSIFAESGERLSKYRLRPEVGYRAYAMRNLKKTARGGGCQPEVVYFRTPQPLQRASGVLRVESSLDPQFRVETKFDEKA